MYTSIEWNIAHACAHACKDYKRRHGYKFKFNVSASAKWLEHLNVAFMQISKFLKNKSSYKNIGYKNNEDEK